MISLDRVRFLVRRLGERLWVRPAVVCVLSIAAALLARTADHPLVTPLVPTVSPGSVETLLSIMATSMLVIATFSVTSMVSAYASAARTATPRSFPVVVADDASQNALSTFVGAFIFSVVALVAIKNHFFLDAGRFVLFVLTVAVFAVVIVTFVRWVDRLARLGRVGHTIDSVEAAASRAITRRLEKPTLGAVPQAGPPVGEPVYAECVGYVQHVDVPALQEWAEEAGARVAITALPGTFATPDRPIARVTMPTGTLGTSQACEVAEAFQVGGSRTFEDDPRFGLIVLSEIGVRALSPGIHDPGTAIDVIGTLVRLLVPWARAGGEPGDEEPRHDRVSVPALVTDDLLDDAFLAIARDGAGQVEVGIRLQKGLATLAEAGGPAMRAAAERHARMALARAEQALRLEEDRRALRRAAVLAGG